MLPGYGHEKTSEGRQVLGCSEVFCFTPAVQPVLDYLAGSGAGLVVQAWVVAPVR